MLYSSRCLQVKPLAIKLVGLGLFLLVPLAAMAQTSNGLKSTIETRNLYGDHSAPVVMVEGGGIEHVYEDVGCTPENEGKVRWNDEGKLESCVDGEWVQQVEFDTGIAITSPEGSPIYRNDGASGATRSYLLPITVSPSSDKGIIVGTLTVAGEKFTLDDREGCQGAKLEAGEACRFYLSGTSSENHSEAVEIAAKGNYSATMIPTSGGRSVDIVLSGWCDAPYAGLVSSNVCGMLGTEILVTSANSNNYRYVPPTSIGYESLDTLGSCTLPTTSEGSEVAKHYGGWVWTNSGSSSSRQVVNANGNTQTLERTCTTSSYRYLKDGCPSCWRVRYKARVQYRFATDSSSTVRLSEPSGTSTEDFTASTTYARDRFLAKYEPPKWGCESWGSNYGSARDLSRIHGQKVLGRWCYQTTSDAWQPDPPVYGTRYTTSCSSWPSAVKACQSSQNY